MLTVTIDFAAQSDKSAVAFLGTQEALVRKAAQRALNKTAQGLRTYLSREVASELGIKQQLIRSGLTLVGARQTQLNSRVGLRAQSGVIKVRDIGKVRQNAKGVKAGKRQFDRAFLARKTNGEETVFRRVGSARLPIREQTLVFTGKLADHMDKALDGVAKRQLQRIFEREIRYLTRR